ncbi:TRAP transporter fused permease subunit [Sulfitobacter sp. HNIBRBA3233]|uniref:TRAP transporter permease n=1 Tax=Sulfitobacter marinivivus TaxID=3158558 RepID=UPI0032DFF26B
MTSTQTQQTPTSDREQARSGAGLRGSLSRALGLILIVLAGAWALGLHRELRLAVYTEQFLAAVLACAAAHVFLARPWGRFGRFGDAVDFGLAAVAIVGGAWLAWAYPDLSLAAAINPSTALPVALALLATVMLALVRAAGWPITIVVLAFGAYGLWGAALPGRFQALPVAPERLAAQLALDTGGMLGTPLKIAATIVVIFVAFGRLLEHLGGAKFFTDLATASMGGFRGGSAKIALVASALFGSISGSAVSNVATTGVISIPLMRRAGFKPSAAGGIEAMASTGGQLTPPVMGAAAFLMAEFLDISYGDVVMAALLPALLFYFALFLQVDLVAGRDGIRGVERSNRPDAGPVLRAGWAYALPFVALIWGLFALNWQPDTAGLAACGVLLLVAVFIRPARAGLWPNRLAGALAGAGDALAQILVITAAAGIVIGVLNETGLGFGLTTYLVGFASDQVLLLLVLAAAISIVLGMGMPTVAVYVLLAALVAPAIVRLGVDPTGAHLFVLYFGMLSMVTPPVAIAAFAAASLAGSGPIATALAAMRFGWPAFVLPFAFAYNPALILKGSAGAIAVAVVFAVLAILLITSAMTGWFMRPLRLWERALGVVAGAALLLWPIFL